VSFINVGASVRGAPPATKKALREALRDRPHSVQFWATSPYSRSFGTQCGDELELGSRVLRVVGPDPYNDRRWYATVQLRAGKVALS
jgi:hypothetical protein